MRDNSAHCDKINEVSHIINDLKEAVIQSLEKLTRAANEASGASAGQVEDVLAAQSDRLNEVSQRIGEVKVVVVDGTRHCLDKLEQNNAELRQVFTTNENALEKVSQTVSAFEGILGKALEHAIETICQKCATSTERIAASNASEKGSSQSAPDMRKDLLLVYNTLNITSHEFHVKALKSLKHKAISAGCAAYYSESVYLRGYYMSPGVYLKKSESSVTVHALICLRKGVLDEFLNWPFHHEVKLSFVHSSPNEKREFMSWTCHSLKCLERPIGSCNFAHYYAHCLYLEDLERGGYAKSDQLCVKWELLPPTT